MNLARLRPSDVSALIRNSEEAVILEEIEKGRQEIAREILETDRDLLKFLQQPRWAAPERPGREHGGRPLGMA